MSFQFASIQYEKAKYTARWTNYALNNVLQVPSVSDKQGNKVSLKLSKRQPALNQITLTSPPAAQPFAVHGWAKQGAEM